MLGDYKDTQQVIYNILSNEIKEDKVKHAYLFDVSQCHNSFLFVYSFIKSMLCPLKKMFNDGCNNCNLCQSIDDNSFPDIIMIEPDGLVIKKDQLLELQENFINKSLYNNKKIYIIKYAEDLHPAAANSILKFLEEPESNIVAILLTKNLGNVLPTIISRCEVLTLLKENENISSKERIGQVIFDDYEDYQNFINSEDDSYIKNIVDFINYYENYGIDILLHTSNLWFEKYVDKKNNMAAYNLMLLYYKDVINYKLNRKIEFFIDYKDSLSKVSSKNSFDDLYRKIHIIVSALDKNKININLALNLDNLILEMEGVK